MSNSLGLDFQTIAVLDAGLIRFNQQLDRTKQS